MTAIGKPKLYWTIGIAAANLVGPTAAVAVTQDGPGALRPRIDSIAEAALRLSPAAGLSLGVVRGNDTIVLAGYGYADLEHRVRATPQTVYRIGSLTKQFTAVSIMQLVEQGKIDLDERIEQYVPDFPTQGHTVTVRHLLTHTSGITSYTSLGNTWLSKIRLDLTQKEVVELFQDEPFKFEPGGKYEYSNSGYFLLGMIIERVTGQPYATYVQQHIFAPLGLAHTLYCDPRRIVEGRAEGYGRTNGTLVNDEPISMTQPFAAGGLCSSVADLLTWQEALQNHRLITAESFRQMTTPATLKDGSRANYGFGLGITALDGHPMIAHGGGINGFNSYLAYFPEDSLTIAVLVNTEGSNPWDIAREVVRTVFGTTPPPVEEMPLSNSERERFVGWYDLGDLQVRVFVRDEQLMAQATGQPAFTLLYQGDNTFVASFDHSVTMRFEVRGHLSVGFMLEQGGQTTRGIRIPERRP